MKDFVRAKMSQIELKSSNLRVNLTKLSQIYALPCLFLSRQTLMRFLRSRSKKLQHNVQNEGGRGVNGFLNNVQKTADLVDDGTPYRNQRKRTEKSRKEQKRVEKN